MHPCERQKETVFSFFSVTGHLLFIRLMLTFVRTPNGKDMKHYIRKTLWPAAAALACILGSCGNGTRQTPGSPALTDSTPAEQASAGDSQRHQIAITQLQDNAQNKLMPRTLFAAASDKLIDSLSLQDGIPSSISAFLLEAQGDHMLFDTGLGAPDSRLIPNLKALGVAPSDIRYLYLTHFHGDHIGGMMQGDSVMFPQAEVYASRIEYEAWMEMPDDRKAQAKQIMEAYKDRLHLIEYNDTLPGGVVAMNGEGHTPGHTIYRVESILVVGDLVHGAALQLAHPEICASYDMDSQKAVGTRKQFLEYARQNNLLMAGMHQPGNPAE